ncbi:MAG TPA: DUF4350 domain-containing protein [Polyangiales bacterium]
MKRLARAGLWLCAAALVIVSLFAAARIAERGRFATPYSSYSAGPHGTRALLLLARALGHDAQPFTRELSHLPQGTLLVFSGCRGALLRKLARPEREALARWIERGGLLIAVGSGETLPEGAGLGVAEGARCAPESEPGVFARWVMPDPEETLVESRLPAMLTAEPVGPPLTHMEPFDVDEPMTLRVGHDSEATELLTSEYGSLALTAPLGRGRIVLLGTPAALTNHALSAGGGVLLARLLRAFAPRGPVLFDEYHLGMGERRSLVGYLRDAGYSAPLLQLALAALTLLAASAVRVAPPRVTRPTPQTARAFADALANLLQRSGDVQGALERLSGHALTRIASHYHARAVPLDQLPRWLESQGLFAVAAYVVRVREHAEQPLAPGESLTQRAQAIERDATAAVVVGEAR